MLPRIGRKAAKYLLLSASFFLALASAKWIINAAIDLTWDGIEIFPDIFAVRGKPSLLEAG